MIREHHRAAMMASSYHANQVRKYTGEPYTEHLREVAALVKSVEHTEDMLCAAWLHDALEDTAMLPAEIIEEFGIDVYKMVWMLSDTTPLEAGNREFRKKLYAQKISIAPASVQTIKLADLISNARSIFKHDAGFSPVFASEMDYLLRVLKYGDCTLYTQALNINNDYYAQGSAP